MKYKEWLHDWLELYEKESVKPRTYKQYEDIINKRLIPALGDYEMEDLSPIILQRYIVDLSQKGNTMTGKGLAPNSVISWSPLSDLKGVKPPLEFGERIRDCSSGHAGKALISP